MDRRKFLGMSGASAATLALTPNDPNTLFAELLAPLLPGAQTAPGNGASIDIGVTGTYMEEYETGVPWSFVDGINGTDIPYLAKDGTAQIISVPYNIDLSVNRMHPSDSLGGWSLEKVPIVSPGRTVASGFSMAVATGDPGGQDFFYLYSPFYIFFSSLSASGQITRLVPLPGGVDPTTKGQMPAGVRYQLETLNETVRSYPGTWPSAPQLRDCRNPSVTFRLDPAVADLLRTNFGGPRCFPLRGANEDQYRAIVLGQGDTILSVLLARDRGGSTFTLREKQVIGHSADGRIFVNELTPGQVEVLIFNLPTVQSIVLSYTPAGLQPVTTRAASSITIPAWNMPGFSVTGVYATANPLAKTIELRIAVKPLPQVPREVQDILDRMNDLFGKKLPPTQAQAEYLDVWFAERSGNGQWSPLTPAVTTAVPLGGYLDGRFALNRRYSGYEVWRLNADLDYDVDRVFLDLPGALRRSSQAFRVGISVSSNGMALSNEPMTMRASDYAHCTLGGKLQTLRPRTPTNVTTDGTGTLWISLTGEDGMNFPVLYLSSGRFTKTLAIDLNQKMKDKIASVSSASQLRAAKDPRDGSPLMPDQSFADDLSGVMNALLDHAPVPVASAAAPANVTVHVLNGIAVGWIAPLTTAALAPLPRLTRPAALVAAQPWIFSGNSGARPSFQKITGQQAADQVRTVLQETNTPGGPQVQALSSHSITAAISCDLGFYDPCQAASDLVETIVDGIAGGLKIIYDGAKLVVEYTINGIKRLYEGVLEVWENIKDALVFILDAAGMLWGKMLRAILDFFFDWGAILKKRDDIKAQVRAGAMKFTTAFPDPRTSLAGFRSSLASLGTQLNTYRSSAGGKRDLTQRSHQTSPMASIFPSFATEGTWLMEKLVDALPDFTGGLGSIDIPELKGLETQVLRKVVTAATSLAPSMNDLGDGLLRVLQQGFDPGTVLDTVLDLVIAKLTGIIAAITDLIDLAGDVLHALWANPGKVVDWFDTPLPIPGLRTFYKELFDNELSMLDFVCSVAAVGICAVNGITGSSSQRVAAMEIRPMGTAPQRPAPMTDAPVDQTAVNDFAIAFSAIGCATTALDAGFTATSPAGSKLFTALNVMVSIGGAALTLAEENDIRYDVAACGVAGLVGLAFFAGTEFDRRWIVTSSLAVLMLFHGIFSVVDGRAGNARGTAYSVLATVQLLGGLILRVYKGALQGPPTRNLTGYPAIAFTAWQTGLSVGKLLTIVA